MRLSQFCPGVRTVKLGGLAVLAREWKVGHLLKVERWFETLPNPLTGIDESSEEYADLLRELYDSDWPPSFGTDAADQLLFGSPEGRALFLRITLRPSSPEIVDSCDALAEVLDAGHMQGLADVAFGSHDTIWKDVVARIDRHLGIEPFEAVRPPEQHDGSEPMTWGDIVAGLCTRMHITPAQARDLYLSEVHGLRMVGVKKEDRSEPVPLDEELHTKVGEKRWSFWAPWRSKKFLGATSMEDDEELRRVHEKIQAEIDGTTKSVPVSNADVLAFIAQQQAGGPPVSLDDVADGSQPGPAFMPNGLF